MASPSVSDRLRDAAAAALRWLVGGPPPAPPDGLDDADRARHRAFAERCGALVAEAPAYAPAVEPLREVHLQLLVTRGAILRALRDAPPERPKTSMEREVVERNKVLHDSLVVEDGPERELSAWNAASDKLDLIAVELGRVESRLGGVRAAEPEAAARDVATWIRGTRQWLRQQEQTYGPR